MIVKNSILLLKSESVNTSEPDKYEELLKINGFDVKQIKTLIFTYINLDRLNEKLDNPDYYSGLILSSPRCVMACSFDKNRTSIKQWNEKSNFAVGEATRKAAMEKLSLNNVEGSEAGNAENLTRIILENRAQFKKPFLYPHGNLKSDTIYSHFNVYGLQLDGLEVYQTGANPELENDLLKTTQNFEFLCEFIVFFSPSGFLNSIEFLKKIPIDIHQIKFIAIGPTTAKTIVENGYQVYNVAKQPNPESVLNAIKNE